MVDDDDGQVGSTADPVVVDDDAEDTTFDPERLPLPVDQVAIGRERFGLDTSPEVLSRIANDLEAVLRGGDRGFPISEQEAAELETRLDLQATSEPVFEVASQLAPEQFSGVWVDMAIGQIVVAFTDDPQSHTERLVELQKVAKYPDRIRIEQTRFTLAELDLTFERLREARLVGDQVVAGIEVSSVAVHMMRNVIHVAVVGDSAVAATALAAYLEVDGEILEIDTFTGEVEVSKPRGVTGSLRAGPAQVVVAVWLLMCGMGRITTW